MLARAVILIALTAIMLLCDRSLLRSADKRSRIIYWLMLAPSVYLGAQFIADLPWPNLDELLRAAFRIPAEQITSYLKGSQS
ncbi:hypothetical protein ACX93W_22645 [Paenibacillus sp. CAU 1782]